MRFKLGTGATVVCCGFALLFPTGSVSLATAGGPQMIALEAVISPLAMGEEGQKYGYVGSKTCKMCHMSQHKSWADTKMGKSFEILKPGQAAEVKTKHGLDPAKDYSTDKTCLKCHTTGFGEKDGYAIPDAEDKKSVKKAKRLQGVGCESCHGPGSEYVKVHKEIMKSKRKYTAEELQAVGMKKIEASTCTSCHNDKGPTHDKANPFDFAKQKDEGIHAHKELKQRAPK